MEKLQYFKKYIDAYLYATKRLPFKYYIDAFAGTGRCVLCNAKCDCEGGIRCEKCESGKIVDGSALISLKLILPFDLYILIELKKDNRNELEKFINEDINDKKIDSARQNKIKIVSEDCNSYLQRLSKTIKPNIGCVIFLDATSDELSWETVKSLSKIERVDLLILYPYDMSLTRLTKNYKVKLDRFYGDSEWLNIYNRNLTPHGRREALLKFYKGNLIKLGFKSVEKHIKKRLRAGHPLYHLVFATRSDVGLKIMSDIFNKELDGQTKMQFNGL